MLIVRNVCVPVDIFVLGDASEVKGKEGIDEEFIDQRISNELAMNYII